MKNCKECESIKLHNPKHPICNYHQGVNAEQKRILKIIDEVLDIWVGYGVFQRELEMIKEKIKESD